jgi:hypothetical protein
VLSKFVVKINTRYEKDEGVMLCTLRCLILRNLEIKVGIKYSFDRLCGLVFRVLGYRSGGPGLIPGTTRKKLVGLERGPLSLASTTEKLLDRKVAAPV